MTDEQIKQNAEDFAKKATESLIEKRPAYIRAYKAYLAGAHSRDEEVEQLKDENTTLLNQCEEQRGFIAHLKAELAKAKNPWVSVEERLPETKKCVNPIERSDLVIIRRKGDRYPMRAWYWNDGKFTTPDVDETPKNSISEIDKSEVKAWMPIPEGGEL